MNNKDLGLIYKGLSHILFNQRQIMEYLNIGNFYAQQDADELAVLFGKLSKAYYNKEGE